MKYLLMIFIPLVIFYTGCTDDSSSPDKEARIRMYMTDAPAAYDSVIVTITGVDINKDGQGWISLNSRTQTFNLLDMRNGVTVLFADSVLTPGKYTQIRLIVDRARVVVNGSSYSLEIPSGSQTGIKLNHSFDIAEGQVYELLLDFDANKSIHQTGNGQYKMNPVIRVIPMSVSGKISGRIMPESTRAYIWTISASDTVSTYASSTGNFKIIALKNEVYSLHITPQDTAAFKDTVISNITVIEGRETEVGTITLRSR